MSQSVVSITSNVTNITSNVNYGALLNSCNLSDLCNITTAKANLGINFAPYALIANVPALANNLSDIPDKATARANLGISVTSGGQTTITPTSGNGYLSVATDSQGVPVLTTNGSTTPHANYLVAYDSLCNIACNKITATNLSSIFQNIAQNTFVNGASINVGTISITGNVPLTFNFYGNASVYYYDIIISNTQIVTNASSTSSIVNTNISKVTGTYTIGLNVRTNGSGDGSSYSNTNITSFTVGATDNIGYPGVSTVYNTSSDIQVSTAGYAYMSGVSYYSTNTILNIPAHSAIFVNLVNTIDPGNVTFMTINNTSYTYSQVFTNYHTQRTYNDYAISFSLTSRQVNPVLTNILHTGTNNWLIANAMWISADVSSAINVATFSGVSAIQSSPRCSVVGSTFPTALTNVISYDLAPSSFPRAHDAFYVQDAGGRNGYTNSVFYLNIGFDYYTNFGYDPSNPHDYLVFCLVCTSTLSTFAINITSDTSTSLSVSVNWASLNTWLDASTSYLNGGCALSTPSNGRYAVTSPSTLTGATNIYIAIQIASTNGYPIGGWVSAISISQ